MLDTELFGSIAAQMMSNTHVKLHSKSLPVQRTSGQHFKTVTFTANGRKYAAIEKNPEKPSQWAKLARDGHQVIQFKDVEANRFVAVAVDGRVKEYKGRSRRKAARNRES